MQILDGQGKIIGLLQEQIENVCTVNCGLLFISIDALCISYNVVVLYVPQCNQLNPTFLPCLSVYVCVSVCEGGERQSISNYKSAGHP